MALNVGRPPESIVKALSKGNRGERAKALGALFNWARSEADQNLAHRSLQLLRRTMHTLEAALPDTDPELIGGLCAHLLDLWETGQKLDNLLKELPKFQLPRDRERMRSALLWIEAIQLDMSSYWIHELKKRLPLFLKALDRRERSKRPRTETKPPKQSRKLA
jgi:hypothetical protein